MGEKRFWSIDSIPIQSKEGLEQLNTRLNALEAKGFTIEGVELYGQNRLTALVISHRPRLKDDKNEVKLYEKDL